MMRAMVSVFIFGSLAYLHAQGCVAFIDAYTSSPTGSHQRTGQFSIRIDADCFALASPENPIFIRVGYDRNITLSETLVDPFDSGPLSFPIDLAVRLSTFLQPGYLNKTPRDAISIVRWRKGESAFWLKIASSSSTWINDGQTVVPPTPLNELEFFVGHSAWKSQEMMASSGWIPNMNRNTRRNGAPVSTFILADISDSGLILDPDPNLSFLNYEIQAMDAGTSGVTTEPLERDIQFGALLPSISFPMMNFPRVCLVVRAGDLENILFAPDFPDKNFRDFLMHRFTYLTRTLAMAQTELRDFPGLLFGIPLPIHDLTGLQYFENLEHLSCEGEPLTQLSDLSGFPALRRLRLFRNRLTAAPGLPPGIEDVDIAENPIRQIGSLTAVSDLGTQSHHRIVLERNLLNQDDCPDLITLRARTDLSGASLAFELQGGVHGQNLSYDEWPNHDIGNFVADMPYTLICPP